METLDANRCFMRFQDRAERITTKQVAETFVSVGPLMDLLDSSNNQIMYGRRGTGKTHALRYFQGQKNLIDLALYVDAQNIGSNGSIYNDTSITVAERATRLLVDICSAIHHDLLEIFTNPACGWDLSKAAPIMDKFIEGFTETRISGSVEQEYGEKLASGEKSSLNIGGGISGNILSKFDFSGSHEVNKSIEDNIKLKVSGKEETLINFNYFSQAIRLLADFVSPKRIWILIDEWTTIPADIQPYLADLIRRSMFSIPNITTKIAAIEHRSRFKIERRDGGYIGFELGADISAAINLDDYLVIDNNEDRAKDFFRNFVTNHALAIADEINVNLGPRNTFINSAFTQESVFTEFVRATEGVPRDAMHILALAAQRANMNQISMPLVRAAAHAFFQTEKYSAIQANPENRALLDWIRDEVIGDRRTRAFLRPMGVDDPIIDRLFDQRALHILNRSRSAAHRPGERFVVYKLDYGLYVDLSSTDRYPTGLLVNDAIGSDIEFDVPLDDARSYRRAVLDIERFYRAHPEFTGSR